MQPLPLYYAAIYTQVRNNFFLVHGPPNQWLRSELQVPPPHALRALAGEDFASKLFLSRFQACMHWLKIFKNSTFSETVCGIGLRDGLVTIWVLEHPWGPT